MFGPRGNSEIRFMAAAADRLFSVDFESTSVAAGGTASIALTAGAGETLWVSCFLASVEGNQSGKGTIQVLQDDAASGGDAATPRSRSLGGDSFATAAPNSSAKTDVTLSGSEVEIYHKKMVYEHSESVCPFKVIPGATLVLVLTNNELTSQDLDLHLNFFVG